MNELLLRHIQQYIELTPEEQAFVQARLKERKLKKRQFLVQAGDVCKYDSFVIKGCLRAYYTTPAGAEYIVQFALEGWWMGDAESFLTGRPAQYDVEALEDCVLLQVDAPSLEEIYSAVPRMERYFRMIFQRSFYLLQRRVLASLSQTAEERYLDFAARYPQILNRIPQYQIAAYLGMTPESLSKIRHALSERRS